MDKLLTRIYDWMMETYGDARLIDGLCRTLVRELGNSNSSVMLEISAIDQDQLAEGHKGDVIQIFSTLATNLEDEVGAVLPNKLAEVNRATLLGHYSYMASHQYIVHTYRMQLDLMREGAAYESVLRAVDQILHQHDMYIDYILITAEDPEELAFEDYRVGYELRTF